MHAVLKAFVFGQRFPDDELRVEDTLPTVLKSPRVYTLAGFWRVERWYCYDHMRAAEVQTKKNNGAASACDVYNKLSDHAAFHRKAYLASGLLGYSNVLFGDETAKEVGGGFAVSPFWFWRLEPSLGYRWTGESGWLSMGLDANMPIEAHFNGLLTSELAAGAGYSLPVGDNTQSSVKELNVGAQLNLELAYFWLSISPRLAYEYAGEQEVGFLLQTKITFPLTAGGGGPRFR